MDFYTICKGGLVPWCLGSNSIPQCNSPILIKLVTVKDKDITNVKKLAQKETVFQFKMINMLHCHLPAEGSS